MDKNADNGAGTQQPASAQQSAPRSEQLFRQASELFPGGVNSPVRAFRKVGGTPRFFVRGRGATLQCADGRRYLDFNMSWGTLLHGHAFPPISRALRRQLAHGTSFGAPTKQENHLAELMRERVPGLERIRFVSSGTEATMSAIRLARAATQRQLVVKFDGCYHGHSDGLLVAAGSGMAEALRPDSEGILTEAAKSTISLPYNDTAAVERFMASRGTEVAAIIVEPVAANMGLVLPAPGFLAALRGLCTRFGALLIFDEVITGFRVAPGGAQELFGIQADLVCFGKIMGGGLPAAAFGGRAELLNMLAPLGPVYQAGTLSGNPLAMVAGHAALQAAGRSAFYEELEAGAAQFENALFGPARAAGFRPVRLGTMFCLFAPQSEDFAAYFHRALARGVYLSPSPYETCFISAAHSPRQLDRAARALAEALDA